MRVTYGRGDGLLGDAGGARAFDERGQPSAQLCHIGVLLQLRDDVGNEAWLLVDPELAVVSVNLQCGCGCGRLCGCGWVVASPTHRHKHNCITSPTPSPRPSTCITTHWVTLPLYLHHHLLGDPSLYLHRLHHLYLYIRRSMLYILYIYIYI